MKKILIHLFFIMLIFPIGYEPASSADISEKVDYCISKLNQPPFADPYASVPINKEARKKLVQLGRPAVPYIVKAIDEGKVNNLGIYVILQEITAVRIEHSLISRQGPEIYLKRI